MREIARRSFDLAPNILDGKGEKTLIIEGRAVVFNSPTLIQGTDRDGTPRKFYEIIDPRAFDHCDMSDVPLRSEHDTKTIYARTRNNSLTLDIRTDGLYYTAALLDTSASRELYQQVTAGLLDRCSFAFPLDSRMQNESPIDGIPTRRIMEIGTLLDVSVVAYPAYAETFVTARAAEAEFDWIANLASNLQFQKEKAILYYTNKGVKDYE